jgi:hypothetical protein
LSLLLIFCIFKSIPWKIVVLFKGIPWKNSYPNYYSNSPGNHLKHQWSSLGLQLKLAGQPFPYNLFTYVISCKSFFTTLDNINHYFLIKCKCRKFLFYLYLFYYFSLYLWRYVMWTATDCHVYTNKERPFIVQKDAYEKFETLYESVLYLSF